MYTQCPECGVAFRVTADVLRQAAGKVRCGGCGSAFNALEHLSEQRPSAPVRREQPQPQLPELTPEDGSSQSEPETPEQTISAEQSAALLKTLDQLAGSNIRIEDTGVEWRVLDEGDGEDIDGAPDGAVIDEILEDSPTPVDEFLTATPPYIDAPEVFEEMRFDDDTPLPDDFDMASPPPVPRPPVAAVEVREEAAEIQVDLDFGAPEDWEDLLGEVAVEVETAGEETVPPTLEADEEVEDSRSVDSADSEDSNEIVLLGEDPPDIDTQFGIQAEALGIDISGLYELDEVAEIGTGDADEEELAIELEEQDEESLFDEIKRKPVDEGSLTVALEDESTPRVILEEPVIPEMTEEEKTINMLIDQDLLSVAVEDEDGFASTIVQKQPAPKSESTPDSQRDSGKDDPARKRAKKDEAKPMLVETIIMEGHRVRDIEGMERDRKNRKLGEELKAATAQTAWPEADTAGRRGRMIAASIALGLLLVLQVMHQSRDALATIPAFNRTVGPLYRMLGAPLTPAYDIKGWRFEATKGETDDGDQVLTIYSRIGNNSQADLPYPLVHVALTDRFEDIIGSRVLEPADYLADGDDPRKLVPAGNSFNAVISIETPSPEATGFRLDVCYRLASSQLRCAIEDFK